MNLDGLNVGIVMVAVEHITVVGLVANSTTLLPITATCTTDIVSVSLSHVLTNNNNYNNNNKYYYYYHRHLYTCLLYTSDAADE